MDIAAGLVLEQGFLPLRPQDLADATGTSKALVYRYFPAPESLYNALLERCVDELAGSGLEAASVAQPAATAAADLAEAYYRYVVKTGPLIHIILRDRFMAGRVSPRAAAVRDRIVRRLARSLRREFGLSAREAVASVAIGMTMPEECGRLARQGDLDLERGAATCRALALGVIDVARRRGAEAGR